MYNDELDITIDPTEEEGSIVSFTVEADEGTAGQIIVVRIHDVLDELSVTFDGDEIGETTDFMVLFDGDDEQARYMKVPTVDACYVLVRIPSFSEHMITVSMVVEAIGGVVAVFLYVMICCVALLIFTGPRLRNILRRYWYLRKE